MTLREMHLFAGAGGGLLGSLLLGHRPVCAVEIDPYCRAVLQARRDEGWLPAEMEIHDDVIKFDGHPWRGSIDLVAGGFPCQDISVAGKGAGLKGARSGLFFELLRVVREVGPKWVYLENVPAITSRGLDRVLGALAELGFDAEWLVLSAADVGAPHLRKRWWCLARHSDGASSRIPAADVPDAARGRAVENDTGLRTGTTGTNRGSQATDSDAEGRGLAELRSASREAGLADGVDAHSDADGRRQQVGGSSELHRGSDASGPTQRRLGRAPDGLAEWLDKTAAGYWAGDWETEPRLAQGQESRVARLRAVGNGQVPQTAAMAFQILMQRFANRA